MTGVELIAKERSRQIVAEGFGSGHDDEHEDGSLAIAAACYAIEGLASADVFAVVDIHNEDAWPFDARLDKRQKHPRLKRLVIAGALIAAEIDRLQRAEKRP